MPGQCDRHSPEDVKCPGLLVDRLGLMFDWYKGMVDQRTGRLLYLYDPQSDLAIGDGEPIRDIAAVWDVEVLSAFLRRNDLSDLIRRSLAHFDQQVISRDGCAIVAPAGECSSIAHSAFLTLALAQSDVPHKVQRLTPLADGILRQQRRDGSYKVFFDAAPDSGEELYPAEAMLGLLEAHCLTGDSRYLDSVERGFGYYKRDYYDRGLVDPDVMASSPTGSRKRAVCSSGPRRGPTSKISCAASYSSSRTESSKAASTIAWRAGQKSRPACRLPAGLKGSPIPTR